MGEGLIAMVLGDRVIERLKGVIDPETKINVVDMGLLKDLNANEKGEVSLKFRPSSFICPLAFSLAMEIHKAIQEVEGVVGLRLEVVDCLWADQINELLGEEDGKLDEEKD